MLSLGRTVGLSHDLCPIGSTQWSRPKPPYHRLDRSYEDIDFPFFSSGARSGEYSRASEEISSQSHPKYLRLESRKGIYAST